jgi:hypothetical protein
MLTLLFNGQDRAIKAKVDTYSLSGSVQQEKPFSKFPAHAPGSNLSCASRAPSTNLLFLLMLRHFFFSAAKRRDLKGASS